MSMTKRERENENIRQAAFFHYTAFQETICNINNDVGDCSKTVWKADSGHKNREYDYLK